MTSSLEQSIVKKVKQNQHKLEREESSEAVICPCMTPAYVLGEPRLFELNYETYASGSSITRASLLFMEGHEMFGSLHTARIYEVKCSRDRGRASKFLKQAEEGCCSGPAYSRTMRATCTLYIGSVKIRQLDC